MKKLLGNTLALIYVLALAAGLCFFTTAVSAQESRPSYLEAFSKLAADKISETMPVGLFGLNVKPSASLYLPIWKFHADGNPAIEYFNMGFGGEWSKDLRGGEAYAGGMLNLVAFSGKVWNFDWAKRHVTRSKFPAIYFGPSFNVPFDAEKIKIAFSSGDEFLKRGRFMAGVKF